MNRILLCSMIAVTATPALAQNSALAAPARPRMAAVPVSPEVLADGRVTFRARAEKATEIIAAGQFGPNVSLAKGEDGVWVGTTKEPVAPGVFEYSFKVDGLNVMDALNSAMKPQRWPGASIMHIPANPPAWWDLQDIPHGTVHQHDYRSTAVNAWRQLVVYTPPGYGAEPLPVFYLAHGFSDHQGTWTAHGKAHWILDALIAKGQAVPMIVVMPDAHAIAPGAGFRDDYGKQNTEAFCQDLLQDVIPLVEKNYRARTEPAARAFAGLSMGGGHALTIALAHSSHFSHVGAFSSAPPNQAVMDAGLKEVEALNKNLKLLWIACGKKDFLFQRNEEFHAALEKAGLRHEYLATEGDHSWPIWRKYLAEFAPRLFR